MKKSVMSLAIVAAISAPALAVAESSISANVTLATDYMFRGVSQTDNKGAIQGGFDYDSGAGFYAGIWASNVDFGTDASTEMDYYFGYAGDINKDVSFDVSFIYFDYEGDAEFDYQEIAGSISFSDFTVGMNYSPEYLGEGGPDFFYPYADYSFGLPDDMSLDLHVGYNKVDEDGVIDSDDDYLDYSIGLSKSISDVDLSLAYIGNDVDADSADIFDDRLMFSISKSF